MSEKRKVQHPVDPEETSGTGALCAEAQADGVPCFERGKECVTCEKASQVWLERELKPSPPQPEEGGF